MLEAILASVAGAFRDEAPQRLAYITSHDLRAVVPALLP
jgi:hypothetical protein